MEGPDSKESIFVHENRLPKDGEIREQEIWDEKQKTYLAEVSAAREMIGKKREQLIKEIDEQLARELQALIDAAKKN